MLLERCSALSSISSLIFGNRFMERKLESHQPLIGSGQMGFGLDEIQSITPETDSSCSFTALIGLPPPQAAELLINEHFPVPPPIDRASNFSVYASADNSPESTTDLSASSSMNREPLDSDSRPNSSSPPVSISNRSLKSGKRKEREKKVKELDKKSKKVASNEASEASGEKLPYVLVRARRGQATDSHSLAERARREKINARMKLLQELVPGCNKISGTAMVLDEIINHVQALQRHVEFLSMKLAAVDTRVDFNLDALISAESGSTIDNSYPGMFDPCIWSEGQINGYKQHQHQQPLHLNGLHHPSWVREEDTVNFITPDNSLLSYDSPANSASLHPSQLKMEL